MKSDIIKLAYSWVESKPNEIDTHSQYYCQTRDIFQARLNKMTDDLLKNDGINENKIYIVSAVVGEIGSNSFDHNLGNWPDVAGIFFAYNFNEENIKIVLVDRGQGILRTLEKVKPELKNDCDALKVAFTERISGRAPENRGNGLKFSKESVKKEKMRLIFISGKARAELNEKMEIKQADQNISGCLAILTL